MNPSGDDEHFSTGTAFITWLACLFGLCGIHRFYLGKPVTGILYLLTFGCLGIGQLVDLFRLRDMVLLENTKRKMLMGRPYAPMMTPSATMRQLPPAQPQVDPTELMRMKLLEAARQHGGTITVAQGVMATGKPFKDVEKFLDEMAVAGYAGIDNDAETGAVIYTFGDLR